MKLRSCYPQVLLKILILAGAKTEICLEEFCYQVFTLLPGFGCDRFTTDFNHFFGVSEFGAASVGNRKLISVENL